MYRGGRRERQSQRDLNFFHVFLGIPPCQKQTKIWPPWDFSVKSDTDKAQGLIQEALANSSLCQGISIKMWMVSILQSRYYLDHRVAHIDWWLRFLVVHGLKAAFWSVKMNSVMFYWSCSDCMPMMEVSDHSALLTCLTQDAFIRST